MTKMDPDVEGKVAGEKRRPTVAGRWPDGGSRAGAWDDSGGEWMIGRRPENLGFGRRTCLSTMARVVRSRYIRLGVDLMEDGT